MNSIVANGGRRAGNNSLFGGRFFSVYTSLEPLTGGKSRFPSDLAEDVIGCSEFECFWQVYHRIWLRTKMDVVNLNVSGQTYHRIQSRPKLDVQFVPGKPFSYHRIQSRPKLDVQFVPDKLFHTIEFYRERKRMQSKCQASHRHTLRFDDKPKRMENLCQRRQPNQRKGTRQAITRLHQPPAIVKTTEKILIFRGFSPQCRINLN